MYIIKLEVQTLVSPYKVLGVSPKDGLKEIKVVYRKLSRKYHPDNLETGDSKKFQEITKAWKYIEETYKNTSCSNGVKFEDLSPMYLHHSLFTFKPRR